MFCKIDFNIKVKQPGISMAPDDSCATFSGWSWGLLITGQIATKVWNAFILDNFKFSNKYKSIYIFIRKFKIILDYDYCNLNKYIFIAFFRRQWL